MLSNEQLELLNELHATHVVHKHVLYFTMTILSVLCILMAN